MPYPKLIVMLTWHDETVKNAKDIFLGAKDAPAEYWGFKMEGISKDDMCDLIECMKKAGKRTFLEVLAVDEETCLKAAQYAAECGVDHLIGTLYYESVQRVAKKAGMLYSPFVGLNRETRRLCGAIEDIVAEAKKTEKKDVFGINLSGFRYIDGDPKSLIGALRPALKKPLSIAGSVDSYERLDFLKAQNVWAFTIGSAFFEKKFGETFSEQIKKVDDYLKK